MAEKYPCVYLLTNKPFGALYLGVTSNLPTRIWQHKEKVAEGFTSKYGVDCLVWYELHQTMDSAIAREKNLKNWKRDWEIALITKNNPDWHELFSDYFDRRCFVKLIADQVRNDNESILKYPNRDPLPQFS